MSLIGQEFLNYRNKQKNKNKKNEFVSKAII